jgi:hypothetical protein
MVKSIDKSRKREYYRIHIISERNEYIMELPNNTHNTHSSEAAKQIEFVAEGFNPELPTKEKLEAAAKFDGLVQSTFLRFAGDVKTYDFNHSMESMLDLELSQKDGSVVSICVRSESRDNGPKSRGISLEGKGVGEYHWYYIEDDFVLRHDGNTSLSSMEEEDDDFDDEIDMSGDEAYKYAVEARNEIENDKLEEQQMGLNRQPVGVDEINKLAKLLESAEPRKLY